MKLTRDQRDRFEVLIKADTPPKEYREEGATERSDYADPEGYNYPLHKPDNVRAAISYFSNPDNAGKFPVEKQKRMWARIKRAAKKFGIEIGDKSGPPSVEKAAGPGGHVPDGSGPPPHGRGMGPGKGTQSGAGMLKSEEEQATMAKLSDEQRARFEELIVKSAAHKYTRKYQGPGGKTVYVYPHPEGKGNYHVTKDTGIGGVDKYRANDWAVHFVPGGEDSEKPIQTLDKEGQHNTNRYSIGHPTKTSALRAITSHQKIMQSEQSGEHGSLSDPKVRARLKAQLDAAHQNSSGPVRTALQGASDMLDAIGRGESKAEVLRGFDALASIRMVHFSEGTAEKWYNRMQEQGATMTAKSLSSSDADDLSKAGGGWQPIPGGRSGGLRRRRQGSKGWEYRYEHDVDEKSKNPYLKQNKRAQSASDLAEKETVYGLSPQASKHVAHRNAAIEHSRAAVAAGKHGYSSEAARHRAKAQQHTADMRTANLGPEHHEELFNYYKDQARYTDDPGEKVGHHMSARAHANALGIHHRNTGDVKQAQRWERNADDSLAAGRTIAAGMGKSLDFMEATMDDLSKAGSGPYTGPKGGKWADPQHKIPWTERYSHLDHKQMGDPDHPLSLAHSIVQEHKKAKEIHNRMLRNLKASRDGQTEARRKQGAQGYQDHLQAIADSPDPQTRAAFVRQHAQQAHAEAKGADEKELHAAHVMALGSLPESSKTKKSLSPAEALDLMKGELSPQSLEPINPPAPDNSSTLEKGLAMLREKPTSPDSFKIGAVSYQNAAPAVAKPGVDQRPSRLSAPPQQFVQSEPEASPTLDQFPGGPLRRPNATLGRDQE